jgi:hypothetical protein
MNERGATTTLTKETHEFVAFQVANVSSFRSHRATKRVLFFAAGCLQPSPAFAEDFST